MKTSSIISIIFGVFLITIAIGVFQSLMSAKDDTDLTLLIMVSICAGFSGFCFVIGGIADYNLSNKNKDSKS